MVCPDSRRSLARRRRRTALMRSLCGDEIVTGGRDCAAAEPHHGRSVSLCVCRARHFNESRKGLRIVDRHLGEHLAVHLDVGSPEPGDEL